MSFCCICTSILNLGEHWVAGFLASSSEALISSGNSRRQCFHVSVMRLYNATYKDARLCPVDFLWIFHCPWSFYQQKSIFLTNKSWTDLNTKCHLLDVGVCPTLGWLWYRPFIGLVWGRTDYFLIKFSTAWFALERVSVFIERILL